MDGDYGHGQAQAAQNTRSQIRAANQAMTGYAKNRETGLMPDQEIRSARPSERAIGELMNALDEQDKLVEMLADQTGRYRSTVQAKDQTEPGNPSAAQGSSQFLIESHQVLLRVQSVNRRLFHLIQTIDG